MFELRFQNRLEIFSNQLQAQASAYRQRVKTTLDKSANQFWQLADQESRVDQAMFLATPQLRQQFLGQKMAIQAQNYQNAQQAVVDVIPLLQEKARIEAAMMAELNQQQQAQQQQEVNGEALHSQLQPLAERFRPNPHTNMLQQSTSGASAVFS